MQNLTVNQIQNKTAFSGNPSVDTRNLSIFTEKGAKTQEEKTRNKSIKKTLGIGAGVAFIGLLLSAKFIPQSSKAKIMQKIKGLENGTFKNILTKGLEYTKNIGINFTGVKDNFVKKIEDVKFIGKPYKWFSQKCTNLFTKGGVKTAKKIGEKPRKAFSYLTESIKDIKGKLDASKLGQEIEIDGTKKTLGSLLDEIRDLSAKNADDFAKKFNSDEVDKLTKGLNEAFEGISPKYRENVISRIKSGNIKDLLKVSIYDDMYKKEYSEHIEKIADLVKDSTENNSRIKTILEAINASGDLSAKDKTMLFNLGHSFKWAEKNTKKCKDFFAADLFEKLRELNGGNAPTDVIFTGAVPIGALAIASTKAKTKEDKMSLAMTAGIPLALGVGGTIYSTFNMVAGWKALLVGGIITAISSIAGKTADKIYRKNHNLEESTLPTFNLPNPIENSGFAKTIETGVETVLDTQV